MISKITAIQVKISSGLVEVVVEFCIISYLYFHFESVINPIIKRLLINKNVVNELFILVIIKIKNLFVNIYYKY